MLERLNELFWHFAMLSLLAVGGASATLSDMYQYLVVSTEWMTSEQFSALYALSQAAPGPNVQFVVLFGWQVAGFLGAGVGLLGMCGPSSMLAILFESMSNRYSKSSWPLIIRQGLTPLSIGLLLANGWILAEHINTAWLPLFLVILTVILNCFTKLHPLSLIGLGALIGGVGGLGML